jgi:S-adenosylmethionine hydrolase
MIIYLFTDFGYQGPYVGELKTVLAQSIKNEKIVIDLMHDAPQFDPVSSAYILAALSKRFQPGDACLAVVDPGVGSQSRRPVIVEADGVIYCGPDNGLFSQVIKNASDVKVSEIRWRPEKLSSSFHGRDLFAPALCKRLNNDEISLKPLPPSDTTGYQWPAQISKVIYIDDFGNLITGLQSESLSIKSNILIKGQQLQYAETFSAQEQGKPFWHVNSMGLVEVSVNQVRANDYFSAEIGTELSVINQNR